MQRMHMHTDLAAEQLSYPRAREILAWYRIPKELTNRIVRELITYGLLVRLKKTKLQINTKLLKLG